MPTSLTCDETESELFQTLLSKYGFDAQLLKCIEELAELQVALMHYRDGKASKWEVCEELADVLITTRQMSNAIGKPTVDKFLVEKMGLLKKRVQCLAV